MKRSIVFMLSMCLAVAGCVQSLTQSHSGREYHVSVRGNDTNAGSAETPLKTISAAALLAQPGDTITVGEGTYRESINPPRGGTSDAKRIVYQVASGEKVVIKGSEVIKGWKQQGGGVWKVELGNSFFGDYNPYALKLTGDWLAYGKWHHRGDVYLNGKAFLEKEKEEEVGHEAGSWFCRTDEKTTTIVANFGKSNPNKETVEINVRQGLFMPEISGLKYITVDGFHFLHDASNWAAPNRFQPGAVGTRMGKRWIIQNCTITDCRCLGITLGKAPGIDFTDIDAYGDHIIRNNIIRRCGQSGIAGYRGATRSLIEGNLIEDTNYRREFGGQETAAIKFHFSVDTIIKNNLIRRVYEKKDNHGADGIGAFGIWIDANNQSFRVTGNIVYDTELEPLFFEMNHGPILVDNNIIAGEGVKCIRSNSEADVFAHNLFVDCSYLWTLNNERIAHYYKPHTTKVLGRKAGAPADNKWYNNIFVRSGLDSVKKAEGYQSDYNLFLEGAKKSSFGDEHSVVDAHVTEFSIDERPNGVTVTFSAGDQQGQVEGPWVNGKLVGVFATTGQTIEDRHGNPITVDTDIIGEKRSTPAVGPLANLKPGRNSISWIKGEIKE